jgi:hypothetical protein
VVVIWPLVLALVALTAVYRLMKASRRRHWGDPFKSAFHPRELRELDEALEEFAVAELHRLHANVVRYVSGPAGHVVAISESRHGVSLVLSDGCRLALGGLGMSTRRHLLHRVAKDRFRPARVERDKFAYRVLLRGESGAEIEVHTQRVALAP